MSDKCTSKSGEHDWTHLETDHRKLASKKKFKQPTVTRSVGGFLSVNLGDDPIPKQIKVFRFYCSTCLEIKEVNDL